MPNLPIYLDYNATTPCDPAVLEAMLPYFTQKFGNAASNHAFGWQADAAVQQARQQVATLIGSEINEIVFTSGATESCNLALKGIFETYTGRSEKAPGKPGHIITSSIEHKAVLDSCKHLETLGAEVTYLDVKSDGLIDPDDLKKAFRSNTILVAIMFANNEIGTIMPVKKIAELTKENGALFFSDGTQAVGKIPVNVLRDGIDIMAFSSHKIYGPKGVGGLYVRRKNPRVKLAAQMHGGGHEKQMRSGTMNVPAIVGFGKACEICLREMEIHSIQLKKLRDKLERAMLQLEDVSVNGNCPDRLPNVSNVCFKYVNGDALVSAFNRNLAVSSTSACSSGSMEPSHVLRAIGLDDEAAHNSVRFSLGRPTTEEEIDFAIGQITNTVKELREQNPVLSMLKK